MDNNTYENDPGNAETGSVSLYQQDGAEEFPVLKAFQQYIDAEQAKARKRMLTMVAVFGVLMLIVITVFVSLLITANERNQCLNDRMLEYVMKERERQPVVQQPQPDPSVTAMTAKIEELQRSMLESQHKAEKAELERKAESDKARLEAEQAKIKSMVELEKAKFEIERAREDALRAQKEAEKAKAEAEKSAKAEPVAKSPSTQELEILRLKTLLLSEKKKAEEESAKRKEAELENYRRKHYPELYVKPAQVDTSATETRDTEPATENPIAVVEREETVKPIRKRKPLLRKEIIEADKPLVYSITVDDPAPVQPTVKDAEKPVDEKAAPKSIAPVTTPDSTAPAKQPQNKRSVPVKIQGSSVDWELPQ